MSLLRNAALARIATRHGSAPAAVALAWTMRSGRAISIPESGSSAHVRENAAALALHLTPQDLAELDKEVSGNGFRLTLPLPV